MPTVHLANQKTFQASKDIALLDAAAQAGLVLKHGCRSGRCRSCRARVVSGLTSPTRPSLGLTAEECDAGWILTCATAATSDVTLDIQDSEQFAGIHVRTLPCRIESLERIAPDVLRVVLRMPPNTGFKYLAGQYVEIVGRGGLRRSYSIANAPIKADMLEFHIRRVPGGKMSAYWFSEAQRNDLLRLEGPRGTCVLREVAGRDLVFLATGTGIAPIKAMLEEVVGRPSRHWPRSTVVIWGGRHREDIYWCPEFANFPLRFSPTLSRADPSWTGAQGYVQELLPLSGTEWKRAVVYACGGVAMIESARVLLEDIGLPPAQFHSDAFVTSG